MKTTVTEEDQLLHMDQLQWIGDFIQSFKAITHITLDESVIFEAMGDAGLWFTDTQPKYTKSTD